MCLRGNLPERLVIYQHYYYVALFQPFIKSGELYAGLVGEFERKFPDMRLYRLDSHRILGKFLHNLRRRASPQVILIGLEGQALAGGHYLCENYLSTWLTLLVSS